MEEAVANVALALFVGVVSAALWLIFQRARDLRMAMAGAVGTRLLLIFERMFLVLATTTTIGAFRWTTFIALPEAELLRFCITIFNTFLFLGFSIWALLSVKAIIDSGRMPE